MEQMPFWKGWFSHKHNGPGVRYEVGLCIQTGWIVWINGPFPCGEWPDLRIARESLIYMLDEDEYYVADGGYYDGGNFSVTPTGHHAFLDRQRATVRARHETVNSRFKVFGCLRHLFRHSLMKHSEFFRAVAVIVQTEIELENPLFELEYEENELGIS